VPTSSGPFVPFVLTSARTSARRWRHRRPIDRGASRDRHEIVAGLALALVLDDLHSVAVNCRRMSAGQGSVIPCCHLGRCRTSLDAGSDRHDLEHELSALTPGLGAGGVGLSPVLMTSLTPHRVSR
jgi:hypothetical protein